MYQIRLIHLFDIFYNVRLNLSIDGFKDVQEYIRYPSNWKEIESNVKKLMLNKNDRVEIFFTPVVQIYNILDLSNLFSWIDKLNSDYGENSEIEPGLCSGPEFLVISILPYSVRTRALRRLEDYRVTLGLEATSNNRSNFARSIESIEAVLREAPPENFLSLTNKFFQYTKILDKERGNSFTKTFSELNELLLTELKHE